MSTTTWWACAFRSVATIFNTSVLGTARIYSHTMAHVRRAIRFRITIVMFVINSHFKTHSIYSHRLHDEGR